MGLDHFRAGAQPQVEGVSEDDLGANGLDIPGQHPLDRAVGPHGHEGGGFDHTASEMKATTAGAALTLEAFKAHQFLTPSAGVRYMASP